MSKAFLHPLLCHLKSLSLTTLKDNVPGQLFLPLGTSFTSSPCVEILISTHTAVWNKTPIEQEHDFIDEKNNISNMVFSTARILISRSRQTLGVIDFLYCLVQQTPVKRSIQEGYVSSDTFKQNQMNTLQMVELVFHSVMQACEISTACISNVPRV